jgi:hypothetical protein
MRGWRKKRSVTIYDEVLDLRRDNRTLRKALSREQARCSALTFRCELAERQLHSAFQLFAKGRPPEPPHSGPCKVILAEGRQVHLHPRDRRDDPEA